MNYIAFIIFSVNLILLGILYWKLKSFQNNTEKKFRDFLSSTLNLIFSHNKSKRIDVIFYAWLFFILLHTLTPFFLSVFLLRSDWNVLIAIFTLLVSIHLFQHIYPGKSTFP